MENTNILNQNIKDLENFPKIYKSLELKLKEKVEHLKGIDTEIVETEKNFRKGNFNKTFVYSYRLIPNDKRSS
jgi:hypothetical protein